MLIFHRSEKGTLSYKAKNTIFYLIAENTAEVIRVLGNEMDYQHHLSGKSQTRCIMKIEIISKIEIAKNGEMFIVLASGGKSHYHMIYREAAEVYWDEVRKGFKTPKPRQWTYKEWFEHVIKVAANCSIFLELSNKTRFINVPLSVIQEIKKAPNDAFSISD